jgi:hypothetical protein
VVHFLQWMNEGYRDGKTGQPSSEVNARVRALCKGYRSTADGPWCHLIPEMVATFPNAKFILSVRDSQEVWYKSYMQALGDHFDTGLRRVVYRSLVSSVYLLRRMDDMGEHSSRTRTGQIHGDYRC